MSAELRFAALRDHPAEVERVGAWLHAAFFRAQGLDAADAHVRLAERLGDALLPRAYVALRGREPVGTVSLEAGEHPSEPSPRCCLAGLYVPEPWRGRGVGAALCRHAAAEAARLGHRTLLLFATDAQAYYTRRGWETLTHAALSTANGLEWCAVMEARIERMAADAGDGFAQGRR